MLYNGRGVAPRPGNEAITSLYETFPSFTDGGTLSVLFAALVFVVGVVCTVPSDSLAIREGFTQTHDAKELTSSMNNVIFDMMRHVGVLFHGEGAQKSRNPIAQFWPTAHHTHKSTSFGSSTDSAAGMLRIASGAGFLIFLPGFPLVGGSWQCRLLAVDGIPCTSPGSSLRLRLGPSGGADCCRSALHSPTLTTHAPSALPCCIPSQVCLTRATQPCTCTHLLISGKLASKSLAKCLKPVGH